MAKRWTPSFGFNKSDPSFKHSWEPENILNQERVQALCRHINLDVCIAYPLNVALEVAKGFLHYEDTVTASALAQAVTNFPKLFEFPDFVNYHEDIIRFYMSQNPDNTIISISKLEEFKAKPNLPRPIMPLAPIQPPAEHPPREHALQIVEALTLRAEKGRQEPELERSMAELVQELATLSWELWEKEYVELGLIRERLTYPPATDEQIKNFQNRMTVNLPADYIEFLKVTNGMACGRLYPYDGIKGVGGHGYGETANHTPRISIYPKYRGDMDHIAWACIDSLYFPVLDPEKDRILSRDRFKDYLVNQKDGKDDICSWDIGSDNRIEDGIRVHLVQDHVLKYWTDGACEKGAYNILAWSHWMQGNVNVYGSLRHYIWACIAARKTDIQARNK